MPRHKDSVIDHVKKGTFQRCRHVTKDNAMNIAVVSKAPDVPESLRDCALAVRIWNGVIPELVDQKLISPQDLPVLEQALHNCRVIEILDTMLPVAISEGDVAQVIKISDGRLRQVRMLVDLLAKFGVTARGRQDLSTLLTVMNAEAESDDLEDLLDPDD